MSLQHRAQQLLKLPIVSSYVKSSLSAAIERLPVDSGVDVIVTMLPSAQHVREVYLGQDGILKAEGDGQLCGSLLVCTASY